MAALRSARTSSNRSIVLGSELGRGGEGIVYSVENDGAVAAKIYHPERAAERQEKILAMVGANWHSKAPNVAFPIDALFSSANKFIGFSMPRVGGHKPIHSLYSPTSRKTEFPKANFKFLVRVALNIARSLASVNATGCVVGDINHSGILVSDDARVTLIDCDSFQVNSNGKIFNCKVGVPEFTPPELQGKRLDQVIRTENHDSFGLAVLLFNLLFMGRHPFAGRYSGRGEMPMEKAISDFRFAYSARKNETRMEPPPNVPLLSDVPKELANALEVAFGPVGVSVGRPKASTWVALLEKAETEIVQCRANAAHQYFRMAPVCPWCAMEKAYPGFLAFPLPIDIRLGTPVDIGQLIAAIGSVPDPGMSHPLKTVMPPFRGSAGTLPSIQTGNWKQRYFGGLIAAICSLELFYLSAPGPVVGAIALGASIWLSFKQWDVVEPFHKAVAQNSKAFETLEARWKQHSDNRLFLENKKQANECIKNFQNLGANETKRLADLKAQLRDRQLRRFLEQYYIERATIKGIGSARKIVLRSYGIETAADVSAHRIKNISGFGPAMTGAIVAWRLAIESRFSFNANQPINPADVAAIKSEFLKKRTDLHFELKQWLNKLRVASLQISQAREQIKAAAVPVWNSLKQSELDRSAVQNQLPSNLHRWGFGLTLFFAFSILSSLNSPSQNRNPSTSQNRNAPPSQITQPNATPSRVETIQPKAKSPEITAQSQQQRNESRVAPSISVEQNTNAPPKLNGVVMPPPPEQVPFKWPEPNATLPNLPPPVEIKPQPSPPIEAAPTPRSLENREDVIWIQSRLGALGYLKRSPSGVWDTNSRIALKDFKLSNKGPNNDSWDMQSQDLLSASTATKADESFIGSWSETIPCDSTAIPDIVINSKRATSSGGGVCEFLSISNETNGWRVKTKCTDAGQSWFADVVFSVVSGKLIWNGKTGVTNYARCR